MSESLLEKSLDDIIGDKKPSKIQRQNGPRNKARINKPSRSKNGPNERRSINFKQQRSVPREVNSIAGSRPVLRVKNIHPELNGEDLSNLFSSISPVEFVKFDPKDDTVAYVCFQSNNAHNNSSAISKFDGRKAMGNHLVVENATSLADRILAPVKQASERYTKGTSPAKKPKRKPKPQKKSIDDLDEELSAYMNKQSSGDAQEAEPASTEHSSTSPSNTQDGMNLD